MSIQNMPNLLRLTSVLLAFLIRFVVQGIECTAPYQLRTAISIYENLTTWLRAGDYAGYLEICAPTEPSQWSPVCGDHWTDREALAACNILGYSSTTTKAITGGMCLVQPGNITTNSVEILHCSGTERSLEDCRQSAVVPRCSQWGGVICTSLNICPKEICSIHSYCHSSSSCSNCSIPQELNCFCYSECSPPCMNGGSCVYNNICQCPPYWTGQHCERSLLPTTDYTNTKTDDTQAVRNVSTCHVTCLNGGICSSDGNCVCTKEYIAQQCESKDKNVLILYIIIATLAAILIFSILTIVAILSQKRVFTLGTKRSLQSTEKGSCFEEDALTVNPSYGMHVPLKENINDNIADGESHSSEHKQLKKNLLQQERSETVHMGDQKAGDDYYTTILDL